VAVLGTEPAITGFQLYRDHAAGPVLVANLPHRQHKRGCGVSLRFDSDSPRPTVVTTQWHLQGGTPMTAIILVKNGNDTTGIARIFTEVVANELTSRATA
jgi:hypothetical protein